MRCAPSARGAPVVALGCDEELVAGIGVVVTFAPRVEAGSAAGLLSLQEGRYEYGVSVGGRWLNGDENHQGRYARIPPGELAVQRVKLDRYR